MISSISSLSGLSSSGSVDLSAMRQKMLEKMYSEMDTDGDSAVSKEEFVTALESRQPEGADASGMPSASDIFDEADTNGDGSLSQDEFTTYSAKMSPRGGVGGPGGPGGPGGMGGAQGGGASAIEEEDDGEDDSSTTATDPADTNGDGEVSMQEQLAYIRKQIEKYEQMMVAQSEPPQETDTVV